MFISKIIEKCNVRLFKNFNKTTTIERIQKSVCQVYRSKYILQNSFNPLINKLNEKRSIMLKILI